MQRRLAAARRCGDRAAARDLGKQLRRLPSEDPMDPGYRRLRYLRYADDHLLGFIGPRGRSRGDQGETGDVPPGDPRTGTEPAKTLITHARSQRGAVPRLSRHGSSTATPRSPDGRRAANGKIALRVPPDVVTAQCARYRQHGKPWHRSRLQNLDDYDIVRIYGADERAPDGAQLRAGRGLVLELRGRGGLRTARRSPRRSTTRRTSRCPGRANGSPATGSATSTDRSPGPRWPLQAQTGSTGHDRLGPMGIVSRGFSGRRGPAMRNSRPASILVTDFPVLSAGPRPGWTPAPGSWGWSPRPGSGTLGLGRVPRAAQRAVHR